ncbi:MAG: universal stress protein [Anaerolineales bacterium]
MFDKILVPLDGSEAAEEALVPAFSLARHPGRQITLLRIAPPEVSGLNLMGGPSSARARDEFNQPAEAAAYLARVQERWAHNGVPIETQVLSGAPAELIVTVAQQARVDLIVMSTHGRSGLSRLVYGSVAEAVLRGARTPLLLIPIAA